MVMGVRVRACCGEGSGSEGVDGVMGVFFVNLLLQYRYPKRSFQNQNWVTLTPEM